MTVTVVLALVAAVLTIVHAVDSRIPLWVPVFLLCVALALR